jgi:uncharacterized membrane protein YhhN
MVSTLVVIGLATALAYGQIFLTAPVSAARTVTKALPLIAFALAAAVADAPILLPVAFALSTIGDACLSRGGERRFNAGLAAFLIAHLAYIALFLAGRGDADWARLGMAALLLGSLIALILFRIWPTLGDLRVPVLAYMATIAGMGLAASQLQSPHALAMAGALLFVISDAVLALELFVWENSGWTAPVVWATYIAAQALIGAAFIWG